MTSSTLSTRSVALGAALLLAASVAVAQGPRHPGPGGPPMAGGLVEHTLVQLRDKLGLDSSQQVMFDNARAQTLALRDQQMASRADMRARIDAELAKTDPDLAAVASALDGVEDQGRAARHQVRDQWLKLYSNLRADQKAMVRDAIKSRLAQMDEFRQRGRERAPQRAS